METMIEWMNQAWEQDAQRKKKIEGFQDELSKWRQVERELSAWEQQRKQKPGIQTDLDAIERLEKLQRELWPPPSIAPPPREKK